MDDFFSKYGLLVVATIISTACLSISFAVKDRFQNYPQLRQCINQSVQTESFHLQTDEFKHNNINFELTTTFLKIYKGESIDLKDYITAATETGQDLKDSIVIEGEVNTQQEGRYVIEYVLNYKSQQYVKVLQVIVMEDKR